MRLCVTFLLLVSQTAAYYDYMLHTAMEKVSAKIGSTVELRCTKVIEKMEDDYGESSTCDPQWNEGCYHKWTKDGTEIKEEEGTKYEMKTAISFDYCENFEWTTDLVKKFGFLEEIDEEKYYERDMKCYASALIIKNVQNYDFGKYSCNFSDHGEKYPDYYGRYNRYDRVQNITLFDETSSEKQPLKVEYFENFYTKGIRSKLLMQCVVTGGQLNWFVRHESDSCPRWSDPNWDACVNNTIININTLNSADMWRCYNFSVESHSPHSDITESFIYFQNICGMDWGSVFCGLDDSGKIKSQEAGYITEKSQWGWYDNYDYYYYDDWRQGMAIGIAVSTVIPVIIIFFIVGSIIACVRGKICSSRVSAPIYTQQIVRMHPNSFVQLPPGQPTVNL